MNPGLAATLLTVLWAILLFNALGESGRPSDLLALWIAAQAFATGQTEAIYTNTSALFTMHPPADWAARATANGHVGPVFPYVYPPLWAAVIAPLTEVMTFQTFSDGLRAINIALMTATGWLAWRITGSAIHPLIFIAAGQIVMLTTLFGTLALSENQPQVLVTFLIALTLERLRHGGPVAAGAALALAASLKLYPALFVVLILAARQYRAAVAFAITGGALAAASVLLAGWPMHQAFLAVLHTISATGTEIGPSFNLDRVLARVLANEAPTYIPTYLASGEFGDAGWQIVAKTPLWQGINAAALVIPLAALAFWMRHAPPNRQYNAIWPAAIILVALPGPIAWVYYFCLPVLMMPALVPALGQRRSILAALIILMPFSIAALMFLPNLGLSSAMITLWGLPAMIALAITFLAYGGRAQSPLRRGDHRL